MELTIEKLCCFSRSIHKWLIWIKYISWLYYSNEMGLINQWEDVTSLECNETANSTTISAGNSTGNSTCFHTGLEILDYYGFKTVRRKKFVC